MKAGRILNGKLPPRIVNVNGGNSIPIQGVISQPHSSGIGKPRTEVLGTLGK
jgi:hypothetical protein